MLRFALTALLLPIVACGGADKPAQAPAEQAPLPPAAEEPAPEPASPSSPAPATAYEPTPEDTQQAEAFVAAVNEIGKTVDAHSGDCAALGNELIATFQKHQDTLRWPDDLPPEKARWVEETYADRLAEPVVKLRAASQQCQNDPDFAKAIQTLEQM